MPPDRSSFTALNIPAESVPDCMDSFLLSAAPNTDLYRKPPGRDTVTAPILYTALRHSFIAAEVTVSADWEIEWDQAGLFICAGPLPGRRSSAPVPNESVTSIGHGEAPPPYSAPAPASKWVKVGMEFTNSAYHASSVCATSDGADWAVAALPSYHARKTHLRLKMERIGYALWVWYQDEICGWKKLREVTWFFWGVEDKAVRVGVYASRPSSFLPSRHDREDGGPSVHMHRNLCVDFENLEIF